MCLCAHLCLRAFTVRGARARACGLSGPPSRQGVGGKRRGQAGRRRSRSGSSASRRGRLGSRQSRKEGDRRSGKVVRGARLVDLAAPQQGLASDAHMTSLVLSPSRRCGFVSLECMWRPDATAHLVQGSPAAGPSHRRFHTQAAIKLRCFTLELAVESRRCPVLPWVVRQVVASSGAGCKARHGQDICLVGASRAPRSWSGPRTPSLFRDKPKQRLGLRPPE